VARTGRDFPIIVIQEAGLDGFWIHRVLQSEGIESHVVDAASILTSCRRRRAKTDRIDGETLVHTPMAYKRGEPRVCSTTPQEEDRRRVCRERRTLMGERVRHVNRIKGLLSAQGVFGYEPVRKGRRERLEDLQTGDGRPPGAPGGADYPRAGSARGRMACLAFRCVLQSSPTDPCRVP
jgi:transposase